MKEKYTTPEIVVIDMRLEEVTTLSIHDGRNGTNVLASWLING